MMAVKGILLRLKKWVSNNPEKSLAKYAQYACATISNISRVYRRRLV